MTQELGTSPRIEKKHQKISLYKKKKKIIPTMAIKIDVDKKYSLCEKIHNILQREKKGDQIMLMSMPLIL